MERIVHVLYRWLEKILSIKTLPYICTSIAFLVFLTAFPRHTVTLHSIELVHPQIPIHLFCLCIGLHTYESKSMKSLPNSSFYSHTTKALMRTTGIKQRAETVWMKLSQLTKLHRRLKITMSFRQLEGHAFIKFVNNHTLHFHLAFGPPLESFYYEHLL